MPAPQNTLKAALRDGRTMHGFWVSLADPYAAEIVGQAGFDWLLLDAEHGPNDLRTLLAQLQALSGSPSHPVVRLPEGTPTLIKQALDIGAQSLLIPMVESAEQARMLVRATRYPPEGMRGVGAALARASRFGAIGDYVTTANDQILLMVQAESRAALDALDEILAVDGVDGVFLGPADLAADMGYPGAAGVPQVQAAIADAIARIRAAGKSAGIIDMDLPQAARWRAMGANFVACGADAPMFARAVRELAARCRD